MKPNKKYSEREFKAYEAGRDCALSGANTTNCHFEHFATPEMTKAWEAGKQSAEESKVPK